MKNGRAAIFALCASLLCGASAAPAGVPAPCVARAQTAATSPVGYTATVKSGEARFTLPVPRRPEWRWRRSETRERGREYAMSVTVTNEGRSYTFGFFLWKFPGAKPARGDLSALIKAGQESVFERTPGGSMGILREAGVRVRAEGDRVVITVGGRKNVGRLFSGRPAEVRFETAILDEPPVTQVLPVTYEK